jgi:hypothetical protein
MARGLRQASSAGVSYLILVHVSMYLVRSADCGAIVSAFRRSEYHTLAANEVSIGVRWWDARVTWCHTLIG